MKKLIFILTFFTAILCITIVTYCGQENIIRVGLISKFGTVSSVSINSNSLYVGFQKDENFYNCGTITGDNFSVKSGANYYSVGKNTFKTFAEAKNACGENGVPALTDINCWKIITKINIYRDTFPNKFVLFSIDTKIKSGSKIRL